MSYYFVHPPRVALHTMLFMPPEPFLVFSHRTCPIHYFSLKLMFWVVPCHFVAAKTGIEAHLIHEFMPLELFLVFFLQQTCPFHFFRSKTHVLDGFSPFHCRTWPVTKICIRVQLLHEFMPPKPFLVWSQRTCSIHKFRSKTHVYNSAWYFNALLHSFWWQLM